MSSSSAASPSGPLDASAPGHLRLHPTSPAPTTISQWFTENVQPHEPILRAFLHRKFPSITDIDDLIQETYARVLRVRQTKPIDEPKAYLYRAAINLAYDTLRKQGKVSLAPLDEATGNFVVEEGPDAAEALAHSQEIELLAESVDALPPRCREILVLCKFHGLSYREIAQRLNISESTVNAQVVLGTVRLRRLMIERGVLRPKTS